MAGLPWYHWPAGRRIRNILDCQQNWYVSLTAVIHEAVVHAIILGLHTWCPIYFVIFFLPKFKKLNISIISKTIILIFSVNLPMVNIYNFVNFDPTTCRTSETFWENCKKLKCSHRNWKTSFLVYLSDKVQKIYFFGSSDFNFNFFAVFSKMRRTISTLPVILTFMTFFVVHTSRTCFFLQLLKSLISPPLMY